MLLPPHHDLYKMWSVRVNDIYERFTDLIEPFGIDESWLDVTGSLHLFGGDAEKLANKIRKTVKNETGLTISVGVSFNKVFAKLGSDMKNRTLQRLFLLMGGRISFGPSRWATCCTPAAPPPRP